LKEKYENSILHKSIQLEIKTVYD